jgi:hypothetical protein
MKRTIRQIAVMRKSSGLLLLLLLMLGAALPALAHAQVNVHVNIGPPVPVVVEAPPQMLFLSDPGVYLAVGIPYDVYFIAGRYYYFHGNNWFWARGYRGPWTYVEYRALPPGLRKYKVDRMREYRDHEYRIYTVQGQKFNGKHFYAVADDDDDDRGHGRGYARGHHKGGKH